MNGRDDMEASDELRSTAGRWMRPVAFGAAGLLAGGLLAGTLSATAADNSSPGTSSETPEEGSTGASDPSKPQRSDEELLTGTTADKVQAAALAEYPDATVVRIETDSDGVYEAHLTTAAGEQVTVEVNKAFEVTETEQGHSGGGHPGTEGGSAA